MVLIFCYLKIQVLGFQTRFVESISGVKHSDKALQVILMPSYY
jgi:hypothetical protein